MNNIFQKILLLIMGLYSCLDAFEVNTHQALTRCAITNSCGNGSAKNLEDFVTQGELKSQLYGSEIFEDYYNKTYIQYAQKGTGFDEWNIRIANPNYLGMIEAGSVLEDAVYPNASFSGDGRFNNHFYAVQFDSKKNCQFSGYLKTNKALCYGYGQRTDNIDWVFNNNVTLGSGRKNDYGLSDAFLYYKKSFVGSDANRRKYQAKLFVSIGMISHLLQDMHSPAHCRDNSHAKGDYLEIYGRYDGGFNLKGGTFNPKNNHWIKSAISQRGSASSLLSLNHYYTYEDFFKKESLWVGYNFASESHLSFEKINSQTGSGLSVNNFGDTDSLFTWQNTHPSKSETFEGGSISGLPKWRYIYTEGNVIANRVKGDMPGNRRTIAIKEHGILFDDEHMIAPQYEWANGLLRKTGLNQRALEDTAVNVMPRAVASTQAFINFFFRGQMHVSIDKNAKFSITNISSTSALSDVSLTTFKKGGKFYLYYRSGNTNKFFSVWTLSNDLTVGHTAYLKLDKKVFKGIPQGTKITVLFDGYIGDKLGGYDSYGVGMRGLSVKVVNLPYIEQDPEPTPAPTPDPNTEYDRYRYEVFTVDPSRPLPYRHGEYDSISYDVEIYKNDVLQRTERLKDLLLVSWWNGSAHFGDSSKHHFDIWCEGYAGLCNFLKLRILPDTDVPYADFNIDWTIWNYGSEENSIGLFLYNVRAQISTYYALSRRRKSLALSRGASDDAKSIVAQKIKGTDKIKNNLDDLAAKSDTPLRNMNGDIIGKTDSNMEEHNLTQQSEDVEMNIEDGDESGMTEEEKREIEKIKEEENELLE